MSPANFKLSENENMLYQPARLVLHTALVLLSLPTMALAQTTHVVQVLDFRFEPANITIQAGDTVRWENAPGGAGHNVIAEDLSFSSGAISSSFTFEHTFTEAGETLYYCAPHRVSNNMEGTVTVEGSVEPAFEIDAGLSGNWWNGPDRSGEGAQIEVSDAGGGELVFVVTVYSYGPEGGQIFLIGVGTPDGDSVEVDVFITDGGVWGDDFDPDDIVESEWGSGVFTASSCELISMTLTPNAEYAALGYTVVSYDLVRLTTPKIDCPIE
jgi:plastocyanin